MNVQFPKLSPRLVVASAVLSLGLAASAFAMPPGDGAYGFSGHGMHRQHTDRSMKGMSRLHDDLKLDAKQEALWQDADKAAKENMSSMGERMRKQREETQALLNQPGADLRAVLKLMDDLRAEGQKQREAGRDRWLAVYDALNPEQKEKVRLFFKNRMDRMDHFGQRGPGRDGGKR